MTPRASGPPGACWIHSELEEILKVAVPSVLNSSLIKSLLEQLVPQLRDTNASVYYQAATSSSPSSLPPCARNNSVNISSRMSS